MRRWFVREFQRHPVIAVTNSVGLVLGLLDILLVIDLILQGIAFRSLGGAALALSIEPLISMCMLPSQWESALCAARSGRANWFSAVDLAQMSVFLRVIVFAAKQHRHYLMLWVALCILTIVQVALSLVDFDVDLILTTLLLMSDLLLVVFLWPIALAAVDAEGQR